MSISNRHPVDRLADIRAEMKILKAEEDAIRDALRADGADLSGVEHYARIVTTQTTRLDRTKLEAKFGKEAIKDCLVETPIVQVRLVERFGDADAA